MRITDGPMTGAAMRLRLLPAAGVIAFGSMAVALALTQIQSAGATEPTTQSADSTAPAAAPDESAAAGFAAGVAEHLDRLVTGAPQPDTEELRSAFVAAGAEQASVEVSLDTTPTGLEVDAMTGAAPVDGTCVFGHIRDGVVTVTLLPVLADGQCFVGDQR